MRKPYNRQLVVLVVAFALLLGWLAIPVLSEQGSPRLKIVLISVVGGALLAVYWLKTRRNLADRSAGRTSDDEFTRLARLNAGHTAFMMSMVLWLIIFAAQDVFDSTRTMLGVGILGQCGFYGICLTFFKRTGSLFEDKN
jgi:hypothetical protein